MAATRFRGSPGWPALFARAAANNGVVTLADALAAGIPATTFRRRVRRDGWIEVGRGVWLVPGRTLDLAARRQAALLMSAEGALLSHATAASLHHVHPSLRGDRRVHVVVAYARNVERHKEVVQHRSRVLDGRDATSVGGLATTTVARTLLDVASSLRVSRLEAAMLQARQARQADAQELRDQLSRRPTVPGARRFGTALDVLDEDGADSILERRARRVLAAHGFTPTPHPYPVGCRDGVTRHVDIAFPDHGFGIECDGFAWHGPGARGAFEHDRHRWGLIQDTGMRLAWLTWARLHEQSASFLDEVRRAVR